MLLAKVDVLLLLRRALFRRRNERRQIVVGRGQHRTQPVVLGLRDVAAFESSA